MVINIKQSTTDTKQQFLDMVEAVEFCGYKVFDIGCYDINHHLSEATLIKDDLLN